MVDSFEVGTRKLSNPGVLMRHVLLTLIAVLTCVAHAASDTVSGPLYALTWDPHTPDDAKYLIKFTFIRTTVDPAKAAAESLQKPPGLAGFFIWGGDHNLDAGLFDDPADACRTPAGELTKFRGPWCNHGIEKVSTRVREYVRAFKAAGGRIDFLIVDYENGLANWLISEDNRRAIAADPRSARLKAALGYSDFVAGTNFRTGTGYLAFNAEMSRAVTETLHQALFEPVREFYPRVQGSNYDHFIMSKEHVVPDYNGHKQWSTAMFGTHASFPTYGGVGGAMKFPGKLVPGVYGEKPFDVMRYTLNRVRSIRRSSPAPIKPWVGYYDFNESAYAKSDYYQEVIYHLALCGSDGFLYWNPYPIKNLRTDIPWCSAEQDMLLNRCLEILNEKIGAEERFSVTYDAIPWDSALLVSGLRVGKKVLWRVTAPPDVKAVVVKPAGTVLEIKDGAGAWYESSPDEAVTFEKQ